jgi:hypothetical protein
MQNLDFLKNRLVMIFSNTMHEFLMRFYYIGTRKAFKFMPDTPRWRPASELVEGDVILGLDGVTVTIYYCGPLFNCHYLLRPIRA